MDKKYIGVLVDPRSIEEQRKDWPFEELYSAVQIQWVTKDPSVWKSYTIRNQDGSGSCIAQGTVKILETVTKIVESALPIYSRRATKGEGMYLQDAGDIIKRLINGGTTTEVLCPSQNMNEVQMSTPTNVDTPLHVEGYGFCAIDIDQIAQAIDLHGGVALTFNSNYTEWTDVPKVNGAIAWGHCVGAVDYFMYNGEKALLIEDSWGHATSIGNGGQRIITESFLKARCTGAMFFVTPYMVTVKKPAFNFTRKLGYGSTGVDVVALQDMLKYEGFFPKSTDSTGKFLSVTAKAVKAWQIAHGITDYQNVNDLTLITFGTKSMAMANSLYPIHTT